MFPSKKATSYTFFPLSQLKSALLLSTLHHVRRRYCCSRDRQWVRHVQSRFCRWRCSQGRVSLHRGTTQTSGTFPAPPPFYVCVCVCVCVCVYCPDLLSVSQALSFKWIIGQAVGKSTIIFVRETTRAIGIISRVTRIFLVCIFVDRDGLVSLDVSIPVTQDLLFFLRLFFFSFICY